MSALAEQAARLADYFASGGLVMWPLAALSVWAWTLVLLKAGQLAALRRGERPSEEAARLLLPDGDAENALRPCGMEVGTEVGTEVGMKNGEREVGGWQAELVREFVRRRTGDPGLDERLLHRLAHRYGDEAERGVGTILVFAATAPLLGLLGTVSGMIGAFDALAAYGAASPRILSGGISEALVSTQTGLLVAIPALFAGRFLRRRAQTFQARVGRFCAALARTGQEAA
ncbi:MotA/TolQ/ExbB proton channel family protein [Paucidesulfovibrio longus]|uniref:MotA/TolQ/ExbB proton channel family protein n=1 Tax=Paucidesulfovibrio longus TaxID=889 RepID=UPI0003B7A83F|nr:MotA/TolQ/ExbB proton channel family protein [Paucidesulfovibrio longus]